MYVAQVLVPGPISPVVQKFHYNNSDSILNGKYQLSVNGDKTTVRHEDYPKVLFCEHFVVSPDGHRSKRAEGSKSTNRGKQENMPHCVADDRC